MPNKIKINAIVPNGPELQKIYNNRVAIDSFDLIVQSGNRDYSLEAWSFKNADDRLLWSCIPMLNDTNQSWGLYFDNIWYHGWVGYPNYGSKERIYGCLPIFEVPVM